MIEDDLFVDPQSPIWITGYQIRDPEKNKIYFSLGQELGPEMCENSDVIEGVDPSLGIKYIFPKEFLNCKLISSQLVFKNLSNEPLTNVIIKETHTIGTKQLQQFEFKLDFVAPETVNTWEHQYDPQFKMNKSFVEAAIKGPWNVSTQLYVGDKYYMHTKAMITFK